MAIQEDVKRSLEKHNLNFKSITAYVVFGAIVLVFVLFNFPGQRLGAGHRGIAAQVDNQIISFSDFRDEAQRLEKMYSQFMGGALDMGAQRSFIRGRALENLVMGELLYMNARSAGIYVTDEEVKDYLVEDIPAFQEGGQFDRSRYYQYLESARLSAEELENKLRKEKIYQRVHLLFSASPHLAQEEVWLKTLSETKMNVLFYKIELDQLHRQMTANEKDVQAFLSLPDAKVKIESEYNLHKTDTYSEKEQVHAQHILMKTKPNDADSEKTVLEKMNTLKEKTLKGDFAALAKEHSEDEGSKTKGGDLGFFGKGQMVPSFEEAAFKAKAGEIVGPVKSEFGYHLIKVIEHKPAREFTLDEVKNKIVQKLVVDQNVDVFFKKVEELVKENKSAELENTLKAQGLKSDDTGLFSLDEEMIPKLGNNDNIKSAVFGLTQVGVWSPQVVREANTRYLLQLKETKKITSADPSTVENGKSAKASLPKSENFKSQLASRTQPFVDMWLEQSKQQYKIYRNSDVIEQ